jgi:phage terminase large subunit-like protein
MDTTAIVAVFPIRDNVWVIPWFWIPEDGAAQHEKMDRVPYRTWSERGHIRLTEGNVVDYDEVRSHLAWIMSTFNVRGVAVDPWNATQFTTQCLQSGWPIVEFGQNMRNLNDPSQELERLLIAEKVRHPANSVLDWQAGNVAIKRNADGLIKPVKPKTAEKIDGIMAAIMAIGLWSREVGQGPSVYESRGFFTL